MACIVTVVTAYAAIAYTAMAYVVMAYIATAYIVMAYIVVAYRVMAYIVMAYRGMAYIVMAIDLLRGRVLRQSLRPLRRVQSVMPCLISFGLGSVGLLVLA